jgi:hypothetical protein
MEKPLGTRRRMHRRRILSCKPHRRRELEHMRMKHERK